MSSPFAPALLLEAEELKGVNEPLELAFRLFDFASEVFLLSLLRLLVAFLSFGGWAFRKKSVIEVVVFFCLELMVIACCLTTLNVLFFMNLSGCSNFLAA